MPFDRLPMTEMVNGISHFVRDDCSLSAGGGDWGGKAAPIPSPNNKWQGHSDRKEESHKKTQNSFSPCHQHIMTNLLGEYSA